MSDEKYPVNLVEQGVFTYPSPEMFGWRFFRIEYGGHAEECVCEGAIWLPPGVDPERIEEIFA